MGSPGGQGGSLACTVSTQLEVLQPLGCAGVAKAKPVLEKKESTDCNGSS